MKNENVYVLPSINDQLKFGETVTEGMVTLMLRCSQCLSTFYKWNSHMPTLTLDVLIEKGDAHICQP